MSGFFFWNTVYFAFDNGSVLLCAVFKVHSFRYFSLTYPLHFSVLPPFPVIPCLFISFVFPSYPLFFSSILYTLAAKLQYICIHVCYLTEYYQRRITEQFKMHSNLIHSNLFKITKSWSHIVKVNLLIRRQWFSLRQHCSTCNTKQVAYNSSRMHFATQCIKKVLGGSCGKVVPQRIGFET